MSSLPMISRNLQYLLTDIGIKVMIFDRISLNDIVIKQTMAIYTCLPLRFCQFWSVISVPEPNVFSRD